jgi:hypothetical protein
MFLALPTFAILRSELLYNNELNIGKSLFHPEKKSLS